MSKFLIRYNTKCGETNLVWRIIQDGEEKLASGLLIKSSVWSESSIEDGVVKWNIACVGFSTWSGSEVLIE